MFSIRRAEEEALNVNLARFNIEGFVCPNCIKITHANPRAVSNAPAKIEVSLTNGFHAMQVMDRLMDRKMEGCTILFSININAGLCMNVRMCV